MRLWSFRVVILLSLLFLCSGGVCAQSNWYRSKLEKDTVEQKVERRFDKRADVRYRGINRILPTQNILQFAGNMGLVSYGVGWDYGRRGHFETDILVGFLPKYSGEKNYVTLTLKETFVPWSIFFDNDRFSFEPFTCGLYLNTILSNDFWVREPDRYPSGYYGFSTKTRINLFIGESITYKFSAERETAIKSATLFYEFGAADIYFISGFTNRYLKFWDIFGLSFGVKVKFL